MEFKLKAPYSPAGDQPEAIRQLVNGIKNGVKHQTLLGVTGSGKTFTIANVIEQVQMPVLIISHNKTLAAQLFAEFKEFFPEDAVDYFVSFYDYYQPEAYIPSTDTFIEKDSDINQEIDRLRLKATSSLMSRQDVVIVASVSCIYNIGSPDSYSNASFLIKVGDTVTRAELFQKLVDMQYTRNNMSLERGTFRVHGDNIELQLAYDETPLRLEFFGDQLEGIRQIHPVSGKPTASLDAVTIFPARHYVASKLLINESVLEIYKELEEQLALFRAKGKLLEAQRLEQRTLYDIEMLREVGFVSGIENYSRILDGRPAGSKPYSLINFYKRPFLTIIDESHVTLPQVRGMFNGDRARKETLVEHGFRLPCALDNRPLRFEEFEELLDFVIYISATPADYELAKTGGVIVEQMIRPTGLVDPNIEIKPASTQIDDLIGELRTVIARGERALVTALTKKMSEDLTEYLESMQFKVRYLHSEIDTLDRPAIIRDLRLGVFDVLVGVNLLREGLDMPEVALVVILDADKEGFLRSARSLIQIAGRAARNINGRIILYADKMTDSIKKAVGESGRRRAIQLEHNAKYDITPVGISSKIHEYTLGNNEDVSTAAVAEAGSKLYTSKGRSKKSRGKDSSHDEFPLTTIDELQAEMVRAAANLEFERAAKIRDRLQELRNKS